MHFGNCSKQPCVALLARKYSDLGISYKFCMPISLAVALDALLRFAGSIHILILRSSFSGKAIWGAECRAVESAPLVKSFIKRNPMLRDPPLLFPVHGQNVLSQPSVEYRISLMTGDLQGKIWTGKPPQERGGYTEEELTHAASDSCNAYSLMFLRAAFHNMLPAVKILEQKGPVSLPLQPKLMTIDTKILGSRGASLWPDALHERFIEPPLWSGSKRESVFKKIPPRLPALVIDAATTIASGEICLVSPKDWQFVCLTHVWGSQLLNWSRIAVSKVGAGNDCSLQDYCRAVADASKLPDFGFVLGRLMKVLRVVVLHGHRFLWMDMVCINQANREQRDAELSYMASFYRFSQCTFVLLQGLEGDMKIWSAEYDVPKWFSRVWTLQEALLPSELRVFVEVDNGVELRRLAERTHALGCASMREGLETWHGLATMDDNATVGTSSTVAQWFEMQRSDAHINVIWRDHIHPTSFKVTQNSEDITCELVAVRATTLALLLQEKLKRVHASRKPFEFQRMLEYYERVLKFLCTRRTEDNWDPVRILQEIQRRSCTFEEDRIIGSSGILGLAGQQVRSGRSLNDQIRGVVEHLDNRAAVYLCVAEITSQADAEGGDCWIPALRSFPDFPPSHPFVACCKFVACDAQGLHLNALFWSPYTPLSSKASSIPARMKDDEVQFGPDLYDIHCSSSRDSEGDEELNIAVHIGYFQDLAKMSERDVNAQNEHGYFSPDVCSMHILLVGRQRPGSKLLHKSQVVCVEADNLCQVIGNELHGRAHAEEPGEHGPFSDIIIGGYWH